MQTLALLLTTLIAADAAPRPEPLPPGAVGPPLPPPATAPASDAAQEGEAEEAEEEPEWTGSINLGFSTTSGNTDVTQLSFDVKAKRETEEDRYNVKFFHLFTEEDGDVTQRKTGGSFQYDYFLSERSYLYARTSAESDNEADLDLRLTVGVGGGRKVIDTEKQKLDLELGLSYVDERFEDSSNDTEFVALRVAANYSYEFNDNVRFESDVELLPSLEDSEDFVAKADNRLIANLSEKLFVQLQVVFDYDNSPAAGRDELDGRYVASVGYTF